MYRRNNGTFPYNKKRPKAFSLRVFRMFCYAMNASKKYSTENATVRRPVLAPDFTAASSDFLFSDTIDTPPTIKKAIPTIKKKRFTRTASQTKFITVNSISPYSTKINTFLESFDTKSTSFTCANITKRCQLLKYAYFLAI